MTPNVAGETQTRTVNLSDERHPALPAGGYVVSATWWNFDRGARAGLEEGVVVVGEVSSEAVPFDR